MKPSALAPRSRPPTPPIRLGATSREAADTRYGTWLVWFMRVLALAWIGQGLLLWLLLLLSADEGAGALAAMPRMGAGVIIAFAVLDLIAGVGLWLAAAWGGVVWLVAVAGQWLTLALLPGFFPYDTAIAAAGLAFVVLYFVLTFKAAHEYDQ